MRTIKAGDSFCTVTLVPRSTNCGDNGDEFLVLIETDQALEVAGKQRASLSFAVSGLQEMDAMCSAFGKIKREMRRQEVHGAFVPDKHTRILTAKGLLGLFASGRCDGK